MNAVEELNAKIADFLAGRYGNLTTEEIEEFREAQADPDGSQWEREHAGEAFFVDPLELNGSYSSKCRPGRRWRRVWRT